MLITHGIFGIFALSWCQQRRPEPLWTRLEVENWSVRTEVKESILLQLVTMCSLDTVWRCHTLWHSELNFHRGLSVRIDSPASRLQFVTLSQTKAELLSLPVLKDRSLNIYLRIWIFIFGSLIFPFFFFFFFPSLLILEYLVSSHGSWVDVLRVK